MDQFFHPQSPTHRSPDITQVSLSALAQTTFDQRPSEPTPAQRFVMEHQQLHLQPQPSQPQQPLHRSPPAVPLYDSSSTAVDDLTSKASSNMSSLSMFESAASSSSSLEEINQHALTIGLQRVGLDIHDSPVRSPPRPLHPSHVLLSLDEDDHDAADDDDDSDCEGYASHEASTGLTVEDVISGVDDSYPDTHHFPHHPYYLQKLSQQPSHHHLQYRHSEDDSSIKRGGSQGGQASLGDRIDSFVDEDEMQEAQDHMGYTMPPPAPAPVPTAGPTHPPPHRQRPQQPPPVSLSDDDPSKNSDQGGGIWHSYQPEYIMVNDSYQHSKNRIYNDLEQSLSKLRYWESRFEVTKHQFQTKIEKQYDQWSRQLDEQHQHLDIHQRSLHDREPKKKTSFQKKIKLNVGGDTFETTLTTLQREPLSLLAMMFSGRYLLEPDQDGAYFIDRDPMHFRLVLNYLRDLRLPPSAFENPHVCHELLQEAQYYRIHGLIKLLEHPSV